MRATLFCFLWFLAELVFCPATGDNPAGVPASKENGENSWFLMPAGARPAYMGIHGGTMPVSLLVVADGSSLLGFVGRSGNDFLDVLRNAKSSFSTSRILDRDVDGQTANDSNNAASPAGESPAFDKIPFPPNSLFVTGSGLTSLPVIQMNGSLAVFSSNLERLLPFGFSENPLPIEGEITPPAKMPPKPRYRLIFEPQYLHPR